MSSPLPWRERSLVERKPWKNRGCSDDRIVSARGERKHNRIKSARSAVPVGLPFSPYAFKERIWALLPFRLKLVSKSSEGVPQFRCEECWLLECCEVSAFVHFVPMEDIRPGCFSPRTRGTECFSGENAGRHRKVNAAGRSARA